MLSSFSPRLKGFNQLALTPAASCEGSPLKASKRKITMNGLRRMTAARLRHLEKQRYPLKHLTEDSTGSFSLNSVATKLYELMRFYQVYKSSINQVYLEKNIGDYRLGYVLECLQEMDPVLPILNLV